MYKKAFITVDPYSLLLTVSGDITITDNQTFNLRSNAIFTRLGQSRVNVVYVWNSSLFFAQLDIFAKLRGLTEEKSSSEFLRKLDVESVAYSRELKLKTAKAGSTDRHARGIITYYFALDKFFPSMTLEDALEALQCPQSSGLETLLSHYANYIEDVTGLSLINEKNGRLKFLTVGALSKAYYLSIKYNCANPVAEYTADNPSNYELDLKFRLEKLLPPPLLYMCKNVCRNGIKLDVNSLYPSIEKKLPNLGLPRLCAKDEEEDDALYVYIYSFKTLTLKLTQGAPPLLHNPFSEYHGDNADTITINQNFSIFKELLQSWLIFYDIIDYDLTARYKCRKKSDPAINHFVTHLYKVKKSSVGGARFLAKNLINFLHGKFAQLPFFGEYEEYTAEDGTIKKRLKNVKDSWEKSHFHFVRGAYIYAMAQRQMLIYIDDFLSKNSGNIYYIDTDCIITNSCQAVCADILPCDNEKLGYFKEEEIFTDFIALSPKNYIRKNLDGDIMLTCAGADFKQIINNAYSMCYGNTLAAYNYIVSGYSFFFRPEYKKTVNGLTVTEKKYFYNSKQEYNINYNVEGEDVYND